jgi:hypothetical protein
LRLIIMSGRRSRRKALRWPDGRWSVRDSLVLLGLVRPGLGESADRHQ